MQDLCVCVLGETWESYPKLISFFSVYTWNEAGDTNIDVNAGSHKIWMSLSAHPNTISHPSFFSHSRHIAQRHIRARDSTAIHRHSLERSNANGNPFSCDSICRSLIQDASRQPIEWSGRHRLNVIASHRHSRRRRIQWQERLLPLLREEEKNEPKIK